MFALGLVTAASAADEQRLKRSAARLGPNAEAALRRLWPLLVITQDADTQVQLHAVNLFVNRHIGFASDQQAWGQADYWASPLEALNKGQGDCEDYAIAKYFSLLAAGVPVARMRLVYVRARLDEGQSLAHMVLAYYADPGAGPLILDNLRDEILPASQRPDLAPVFSFNSDGLWQGVGMTGAGGTAARLSRWRDVMARAQAEGFF